MSQRCETTQEALAPHGPHDKAGIARTYTAPPATHDPTTSPGTGTNEHETIPLEKFRDVLREPFHYSLMHPEMLPLTKKIYLQWLGLGPPRMVVMADSDTIPAQEQQQPSVPPDILGQQFFAELTAAGDLDVEHSSRGRKRPLSPPAARHEEGMPCGDHPLTNKEPALLYDSLAQVVKNTQWTTSQADDVIHPGSATNRSRRPPAPIGAEVRPSRSRSRSPNIPCGSFGLPRYDPRSLSDPLEHVFKSTQWSTSQDDVIQAGADVDKSRRPLPPIGAEVRPPQSRSQSHKISGGSVLVPHYQPEPLPAYSPDDDEDYDEGELPCGYERQPTMLDMAERGEWLRTPLGHPIEYGEMTGTGYTPGPRESAFPPTGHNHGRASSWGSED
ncbi:uncharacterized protein TRAVEDRAFT_23894 [Trametes versicolor FP-101664 SS1]|uniref:uncharacterized protein n=1 Tax=Trametes versicolor (strain FP-101664) TaxID=717944 RepID=UPI000462318C|nr:uncharacterized protein TRAVEDRAFT_23894 [Trametes versicolor FP-101664 SS1]EIW53606.1 hypothetical protein TRAVEDRAFT_23894 [Trametes versicolor FP-101664 SS1]